MSKSGSYQAANDHGSEWTLDVAADAACQCSGQKPERRNGCCHQYRAQSFRGARPNRVDQLLARVAVMIQVRDHRRSRRFASRHLKKQREKPHRA